MKILNGDHTDSVFLMSAWLDGLLPELRRVVLSADILCLCDVAATGQTCRQMRAEVGSWLDLHEQPLGIQTTLAIRRHLRRRLLLECWRAGQVGPDGATPLGLALTQSGLPMADEVCSNTAFMHGVFWRAIFPDVNCGYAMQLVALPYFAAWNGWDYDYGIGVINGCGNDDMILVHRDESKQPPSCTIRPWKWIIHVVEWDLRMGNGRSNIITSSSLSGMIESYPLLPRMTRLGLDVKDCNMIADTYDNKAIDGTTIFVSRKKLPNTYWNYQDIDWDHEATVFDQ